MKLRGKRVILNLPEKKNNNELVLLPGMQEELEREELLTLQNLEVFAVGDQVDDIKAGEWVFVSANNLGMSVPLKIKGEDKIMLREMDVDFIWEEDEIAELKLKNIKSI